MIFEARSDSRVVVLEGSFRAFRSLSGEWRSNFSMTFEDLEDDFLEVSDSDRASMLREEAETALST